MMFNTTDKQEIAESLVTRWDWLTEDVEDYDKKINTSIMLENAYEHMVRERQLNEGWLESTILNEGDINEAPMTTGAVGNNLIPKVMFPMIRRVFPNLIANDLVSVQPITGPTGVIYYINYTYSNDKGPISAGDEYTGNKKQGAPAFSTLYSSEKIGPFTATVAASGSDTVVDCTDKISGIIGTDASEFSVKRIEVYNVATGASFSGISLDQADVSAAPAFAGTGTVGYDTDDGDVVLRDEASAPWTAGDNVIVYFVYDLEGSSKIPEMEFNIGSDTVETTQRKLKIRWTKESEQDMSSFHKIDVESELVKMASMEMNYEVDREVIKFVRDSVPSELKFVHDWTADAAVSGNNSTGNYLDRHRALAQKIYQASATISQYNRQGPASWAVVSPQMGAVLSMLPDFKGEIAGGTFSVFEAGKLGNGLKVIVDPNKVGTDASEILLGYKSNNSTYGAGVVYSPYVNWMSNTVTHPDNFNSIRGFFSRYALKLVPRGQWHYGMVTVDHALLS